MIKITVLDQMDSSIKVYVNRIFSIDQFQEILTILEYKYNERTKYWEKGDRYVLLQEEE